MYKRQHTFSLSLSLSLTHTHTHTHTPRTPQHTHTQTLTLHLPSWVSLQRHNRANRQFNPVDMLYLQEPWSDEEEGDDLQEVAAMLVEGDILREGDAEKGGNLPERADALLERGERVKDEGPPLFQVLGEELWEGEPVVVQPRVHQPAVQQRPGMWDYLFTS